MAEDRSQAFLQMIRRSQRGRLKLYFGYGPGVGKTYQMLSEAHRLKKEGIDVAVGLVETHDRAETTALVAGLEVIPRRKIEYRGIEVDEMDVDAILSRRPQVAVVDELAHTNAPGSRNTKRYQDVQDLISAGIHVISAMNVQHLESLYDTVDQLVGVKVRERVPDAVLAEADQVVNVDLAADDLRKRLTTGKIYPLKRVPASLENFFTESNLEHLRELTMREVASQLDTRRRETLNTAALSTAPDQVMVCLSSRGPNSARLLRAGSRLAGRINRNWYAVYVQTPSEAPTVIDAAIQRRVADQLTLANQLGATVFTFKGNDVADTILRFAAEYRVGQIVIGKPQPIPWHRRLLGERSVASELIRQVHGVTIVVVDAKSDDEQIAAAKTKQTGLSNELTVNRIAVWDSPVVKSEVFSDLARLIAATTPGLTADRILERLGHREEAGSTFLNEGIALPHARFDELDTAQMALGLTHAGVSDGDTDQPIEAVFMVLSPDKDANVHLQWMSRVGRAMRDRALRNHLREARTASHAAQVIQAWDNR